MGDPFASFLCQAEAENIGPDQILAAVLKKVPRD
jgi:hypothetical protein